MELYFNKLIIKQLNKDYQNIRLNEDLPFDLKTLKFIRFYKELENVFEVQLFDERLDQINSRLENDYTFYSNDTHIVFEQIYYDYKNVFELLKEFKKYFEYPVINYNADDLENLTRLIVNSANDRAQFLSIKYQELFLSYEEIDLIKLIKNNSEKILDDKTSFENIIEFMCKFNIDFYNFKRDIKSSDDKKIKEFLNDCYSISVTFKMILKIYFKFMIINDYSDQNMINYSSTYLNN